VAADREYLKVTWMFHIEGQDEIANTSLNFSNAAVTTMDAAAVLTDLDWPTDGAALATRMTTLLTAGNLRWADYSELVAVRCAAVSTAGLELSAPLLYVLSPTVDGAFGNVNPQSTVVLSLRSNVFGPGANYGRMYLPHCMFGLMAGTPFADPIDTTNFALAADVFVEGCIDDMNFSIAEPLSAMIISQITGRASRAVLQIAIGNANDTQRRRRNQLNETYTYRDIT